MKKTVITSRLAIVVFLLSLPYLSASAQTDKVMFPEKQQTASRYALSVSTSLGLLFGTAQEFVFEDGYKVSELDWSIKPLTYWGARVFLSGSSGFEASVDLRSGFDGFTGSITDSDYLNGDGDKTHYSVHDCYTERAFLFDFKAGWVVKASRTVTLTFKGSVEAMDFKWSARDGYLQYPAELVYPYTPWSEDVAKSGIVGTGITYTQNYLALGAALGLRLDIKNGWEVMVGFGYSPLVYCNDVDNHLFRGIDFYETMSGGFLIEPEAALSFAIDSRSRLVLDASYRLAKGLVGDTKMVFTSAQSTYPPGSYMILKNGGGAAYSALDLALRYEMNL